jgi:hypothetical protein
MVSTAGNRLRGIQFYTGSIQFGATHDRHQSRLKIVECVEVMEGRKCTEHYDHLFRHCGWMGGCHLSGWAVRGRRGLRFRRADLQY